MVTIYICRGVSTDIPRWVCTPPPWYSTLFYQEGTRIWWCRSYSPWNGGSGRMTERDKNQSTANTNSLVQQTKKKIKNKKYSAGIM